MINKIKELDRASLTHDFRKLYKDRGYEVCLQVLYEFFVAAEVLAQVIIEEMK